MQPDMTGNSQNDKIHILPFVGYWYEPKEVGFVCKSKTLWDWESVLTMASQLDKSNIVYYDITIPKNEHCTS
jgi:hypothetical protein